MNTRARIPLFERLQIESQSHCNRACWFCPRTYDQSGRYLDSRGESVINRMPTEKILDLLDQAQALGFRGGVGFHHYSEPLLDKRNPDLARAAIDRGMQPYLHTNGDVLKHNEALCADIARLYRLIVVGLYDYDTDGELEEARQYWRKTLPGANLEFSPIARSGRRSAYGIGVPRALVPSDARMGVPDLVFSNAPCHRPMIRLIIQHDGEMCNCCEDTHGAFSLGNVFRSSIEELWFSEPHRQIIDDLVEGHRERFALCRRCPLPPTAPAPAGRRIDFAFRQPNPPVNGKRTSPGA